MQIPGHLAKIPGYAEAVRCEDDARNAAALNLNAQICGIEIRQMTLKDWVVLDGIGSPLLSGGIPTPEQLAIFLWVLSPYFKRNGWFIKTLFIISCRWVKYGRAVAQTRRYIDATFQDFPPSSSDGKSDWTPPECGFAVNLVHLIASKYPWSEESIRNMPLRLSFQYLKRIRISTEGPAAAGWSQSEIIKTQYNRKRREERELCRLRSRVIDLLKSQN